MKVSLLIGYAYLYFCFWVTVHYSQGLYSVRLYPGSYLPAFTRRILVCAVQRIN